MTAQEVAELVKGELVGSPGGELTSCGALTEATPRQLSFWHRGHKRDSLPKTCAGCVIVDADTFADGVTLIRVSDPRRAFAKALRAISGPEVHDWKASALARVAATAALGIEVQVGAGAVVEASAKIGDGSVVGPNAFVGAGAIVGRQCTLHPGARIYGNACLGDRVVVHAGAVIGSSGFGLVFEDDHYECFPQVGGVRIGDDVEIGANSCVDRGALGDTTIGNGTKLDNLVHIGHNCTIGAHVVMAAQVGLSGGVVVEDYAVLGGQAGIGEKARIGSRAQLGGQAGLLPRKRLPSGGSYWGTPARPLREHLRQLARVSRLRGVVREIRLLAARIDRMERR